MLQPLRPLGLAALCWIAGLAAGLRLAFPPPLTLALALAFLVCGFLHTTPRRGWPERLPVLLLAAFALLGAAHGAHGAARAAADCRVRIPDGAQVGAEAVLLAAHAPSAERTGGAPLLAARAHLRLGPERVCTAVVRVRLPDTVAAMPAGSVVRMSGEWVRHRPLLASGWPEAPLRAGMLAVDATAPPLPDVPNPDGAARGARGRRGGEPAADRLSASVPLRVRVAAEQRLAALFPRHAPLVTALLVGRREGLDPALRDRFARAGMAHLLAISGMHVGVIAGALLVLCSALRLPARGASLATLLAVPLYLAVIGAPPSAVRAGIMVCLALLARLLQRPASALPVVGAAAVAILALDPLALLDIGFQLSFLGVLGVLAARRALLPGLARLPRRLRPARGVAETVLITLGATLGTAPATAYHFGTVAPVSLLTNLPGIPLMALALVGALLALVLSPLLPAAARLVADGAGLALDLLDSLAAAAAALPGASVAVPPPDPGAWAAAALAIGAAVALTRPLRPRVRGVVAAAAALALLLGWAPLADRHGAGLEVHVIDVGQGDAVALRTPRGRWVLVDAGPRSERWDAGERRVLPLLRARGARRLEALVLTHPDADHVGGAPAVLRALPVARVLDPGLAVGKPLYAQVLESAAERPGRWSAARAGRVLELDGVRLYFLWPDARSLDAAPEANHISAVMRVEYGDFAMLLPGDAPEAVERALVRLHGTALRAQVLKAGHHGSATSTSDALLEAVRPELALVSAGRRNRYGHPAPAVLARLRAHGVPVARTDREGTLSLRVGAGGRWWARERP